MSGERLFPVGSAVVVAFTVIGILLAYAVTRLWHPTTPSPPTRAELFRVESRFPSLRDRLERTFLLYQEGNRLAHLRDTLLVAGETLRVRHLEQEYDARLMALGIPGRPSNHDIVTFDSLMYLAAWTRRGWGFSAPYYTAGFVYASRDPRTPTT